MQLHIEYARITCQCFTAFHQQLKCFNHECQMPIAHSVFKQTVLTVLFSPSVPTAVAATHDQSLLQNDTIALSMNSWSIGYWVQRVETHQRAKFRQNRSIGCEDIKIFLFFKMAAVRHIWITNSEYLGVSITPQNLVIIDSVVYNMNISIFGTFGWKMPIHAPKIGVFGQFDPLNGLQYQPKPKKVHPCMSLHHLSH